MSASVQQLLDLKGKVAVVTGGSRGLGLQIAEALGEMGARVALTARKKDELDQAVSHLKDKGIDARAYVCDIGKREQVGPLADALLKDFGRIDILVNNAGITRDNILLRMKDEEFDEVIAANLKGAFVFTRAVSRGMMKRREGVILNIGSIVGLMGNPGQANYAASKAGLAGLTKSVARELASRNIRCNLLAPGFIRTDMTDALSEAQVEKLRASIPMGTLGEPEDVAGVARFLVGPAARYITGQILAVDGGMVT